MVESAGSRGRPWASPGGATRERVTEARGWPQPGGSRQRVRVEPAVRGGALGATGVSSEV